MDTLLERLSSGQIVAVISILSGSIVGLAMIVAITKYQFQSLADDTALRNEKQHADLSLRDKLIERREAAGEKISAGEILSLGAAPLVEGASVDTEMAKRFGLLDADSSEIEQALTRALTADAERKKMIVAVMDELYENGAESNAILAAVRPLCAGAAPAGKKVGCGAAC
jgi:hypothetical protein